MFSSFDHSQLSLQDCCNDLAQQHHKSLSKVALHKRFNPKALGFLKSVLAEQMAVKLEVAPSNNWQPFSKVLIADSTKFTLPKQFAADYPGFGNFGVSAIMNIQYCFDLKHGNWDYLELTKATQNDQSHSKKTLDRICKDELHIRDLGFTTMTYLREIARQEAFFLNRLHPQWKPVECNTGKAIDWKGCYKKLKNGGDHFEASVTIGAGKDALKCRLIAFPVPEQVWAARIRKAQLKAQSQKVSLSDEYKARCRFSIFITNVPEQTLRADAIINLYRLRWQIELVFKAWKSLLYLHKIKAVKTIRLECQLIAKFIWILLHWRIFKCIDHFIQKNMPGYACSMWKFFKHIRNPLCSLRMVINNNICLELWCRLVVFPIIKSLTIEPKKNKKPAFQIVYDVFNSLS